MSLQILINGLATGSVYALIATGFALIFNVLKFSNFSHGATMTAAAFVAYFLVSSKGMGLTATLVAAAAAGAVIALFGEFFGFRRITLNHSSPTYFFVSSITQRTHKHTGYNLVTGGHNDHTFQHVQLRNRLHLCGDHVPGRQCIAVARGIAADTVADTRDGQFQRKTPGPIDFFLHLSDNVLERKMAGIHLVP